MFVNIFFPWPCAFHAHMQVCKHGKATSLSGATLAKLGFLCNVLQHVTCSFPRELISTLQSITLFETKTMSKGQLWSLTVEPIHEKQLDQGQPIEDVGYDDVHLSFPCEEGTSAKASQVEPWSIVEETDG